MRDKQTTEQIPAMEQAAMDARHKPGLRERVTNVMIDLQGASLAVDGINKHLHVAYRNAARLLRAALNAPDEAPAPMLGDGWVWVDHDHEWELFALPDGDEYFRIAASVYPSVGGHWSATVRIDAVAEGAGATTPELAIRAACPCPAIADALVRAWERRES